MAQRRTPTGGNGTAGTTAEIRCELMIGITIPMIIGRAGARAGKPAGKTVTCLRGRRKSMAAAIRSATGTTAAMFTGAKTARVR